MIFEWQPYNGEDTDVVINSEKTVARGTMEELRETVLSHSSFWDNITHLDYVDVVLDEEIPDYIHVGDSIIDGRYLIGIAEDVLDKRLTWKNNEARILKDFVGRRIRFTCRRASGNNHVVVYDAVHGMAYMVAHRNRET